MTEISVDDSTILLDLRRMTDVDDTGRRMLVEGLERLERDGHEVRVEHPEHLRLD